LNHWKHPGAGSRSGPIIAVILGRAGPCRPDLLGPALSQLARMTPANAISTTPALDIGAIQAALRTQGLDGWLLYDFHGMNGIAVDVTGVGRQGGHLTTRRWYYLIPASGEPRALVHAIESHALAHLPGTTERYSGRAALESGLQ